MKKKILSGFLMMLILAALMAAPNAFAQTPPMCNGYMATIWVDTTGIIRCNTNPCIAGGVDQNELPYTGILWGTPENDRMVGTPGHDTILGGGRGDDICGEGGNDVIYGGLGGDNIFGGDGVDVCIQSRGSGILGEDCEFEEFGHVVVVKDSIPNSDQTVDFTGSFGDFSLQDSKWGNPEDRYQGFQPGSDATYTVTELPGERCQLAELSCAGEYGGFSPGTSVDLPSATASINMTYDSESFVCTYVNQCTTPVPMPVPTLPKWGLFIMVLALPLIASAGWFIRKQNRRSRV